MQIYWGILYILSLSIFANIYNDVANKLRKDTFYASLSGLMLYFLPKMPSAFSPIEITFHVFNHSRKYHFCEKFPNCA